MVDKRIIMACLMAAISMLAQAQEYVVTSVTGRVMVVARQGQHQLELRERLRPATVVEIPFDGVIEMVDMQAGRRYIVQSPGRASVEQQIKNRRTTVTQLSRRFLDYFARRVSGGGEVVSRQASDPAIVTRAIYGDSLIMVDSSSDARESSASNDIGNGDEESWIDQINREFDDFTRQVNQEYDDFREQANREYEDFMRQAWREFGSEPGLPLPKEEKVPPVVNSEALVVPKRSTQLLVEKIDVTPRPDERAEPLFDFKRDATDEAGKVVVEFYGLRLPVTFDDSQRFLLRRCSAGACADAWRRMSRRDYDALVADCLHHREENRLSDWAYLLMLDRVAQTCMGGQCNEATLLMAYLFAQSGYQMRMGVGADRLYLLYSCTSRIYSNNYYLLNQKIYYPYDCDEHRLRICHTARYKGERSLSLWMPQQQHFGYRPSPPRRLASSHNPQFVVDVEVNQNLIDFYSTYPTSFANNNFITRWAMYANTPMEENLQRTLYPQLRPLLRGLSRRDQLQQLLFFVQTAFKYADDDEVWGDDRAFFAEETLFYPYDDCEDRSILLSRLVRDLLGLPSMLVYYPNHLAAAVGLDDKQPGDFILFDGNRFMICDPTYINSVVGTTMPDMDNRTAKVILLE